MCNVIYSTRPFYCDYHLLTVGQLEKKNEYNKIYRVIKKTRTPRKGCWREEKANRSAGAGG